MRKILAMLALVAIAAMGTPNSFADQPAEDPDACNGVILGPQDTPAGDVNAPVLGQGRIIPITNASTGPFYLEVRDVQSYYWGFSIWLYQEDNGVAGLQRGHKSVFPNVATLTSGQDPCEEYYNPDDPTGHPGREGFPADRPDKPIF